MKTGVADNCPVHPKPDKNRQRNQGNSNEQPEKLIQHGRPELLQPQSRRGPQGKSEHYSISNNENAPFGIKRGIGKSAYQRFETQ